MAKKKEKTNIEEIKALFIDSFKERTAIESDVDIDEVVNSIKVDSELKRILAISDRMSYLAKGIISETVRDEARLVLNDMILLVRAAMSSGANLKAVERTANNIINVEFYLLLNVLGLKVEDVTEDAETDKKNRVTKVAENTKTKTRKRNDPR